MLSAECPVICQMQQLLVSMETTHGPFSVFSSSLCGGRAVGGRRKWGRLERGQSGLLIACLCEEKKIKQGRVKTGGYDECVNRFIDLLLAEVLLRKSHSLCLSALCNLSQLSPGVVG